MQGHIINDHVSGEHISILRQLDLGHHSLLLMSDGSLDVLAHEATPSHDAVQGMHLNEEETYRLFISLHTQFQQAAAPFVASPYPHRTEEVQR